jgi:hypothetical protein
VEHAEVLPPERGVARRGGRMPVKEISAEERITVIRGHLDNMENVQTIFAAGAVVIGMELLALKQQVPYGAFDSLFREKVERPRFTRRTAAKYMQAAERVRVKLLRGGNETIADSWNVAPSAMSLAKRRDLNGLLGEVLNGKTLSDLLMGDRPVGGGAGGDAPRSGADAVKQAAAEVLADLCSRISRELIQRRTWTHMEPADVEKVRTVLKAALDELPRG